ncbi:MAG TPA: DUF4097 family beta strand repeat-containing protein [Opitutaceae bacterium]|nr:DUF4097 family beta strand repeat-containing protein [Opitutaceae bacterium]
MGFRRLHFALLLAVLSASAALGRDRVEERTFSPTGPASLRIATYRGIITVDSSDEDVVRVKVTATSTAERDGVAARSLERLQVDWHQEGDTLTLAASNPAETRVRFFWQDNTPLDLNITVSVPRACALDLRSEDGGIRVGDVTGDVVVHTGSGTVFCRHIDGHLKASNDRGDIIVSSCTGDVDLDARQGVVRTGPIRGRAKVSTTNGDIELLSVGSDLDARADAGDVTVGIPRLFAGGALLRADGGNVNLKIDPAANIDLSASSVWGQVRMPSVGRFGLPLTTESGGLGHHALVGRINAGGIPIQARASGGHVNLTGEVPPFN